MSKAKQQLDEILKSPEPIGIVGAIKEILGEILAPVKEMGGEVWDVAKPSFDHGRAELAAVLYTGSAHVMYGHSSEQDQAIPDHGLLIDAVKQPELEQDRGMEM